MSDKIITRDDGTVIVPIGTPFPQICSMLQHLHGKNLEQAEQIRKITEQQEIDQHEAELDQAEIERLKDNIKSEHRAWDELDAENLRLKKRNAQLESALEEIIDHEEYWNLLKEIGIIADRGHKDNG